jgi:hypothetical protein
MAHLVVRFEPVPVEHLLAMAIATQIRQGCSVDQAKERHTLLSSKSKDLVR